MKKRCEEPCVKNGCEGTLDTIETLDAILVQRVSWIITLPFFISTRLERIRFLTIMLTGYNFKDCLFCLAKTTQ